MTEIVIRNAIPDEAPLLAKAHREADWETYAPLFGDKARKIDEAATLERWVKGLADGDIVLAAFDNGSVIGVAHIKDDVLMALYLLASHHRRGIGRRLLLQALSGAAARGLKTIRFNAVANNDRAIAFYKALGARPVGRSLQREADGNEWWDCNFTLATSPMDWSKRSLRPRDRGLV